VVASKNEKEYIEGVGRRKTSVTRVRIYEGEAPNTVNDKPLEEYFSDSRMVKRALRPFTVIEMKKMYFSAQTKGGGLTGQAESISQGLARALIKKNPDYKSELKKYGLTTRDPRMVERKKYNHRKARKKPQFSKR